MSEDDVLDELYGADPGEFVATRTRLATAAREAGDRAGATRIRDLRKPTLAAWAINRLVRDRPAEVEALLVVGVQMREATAKLDMARLRDLRPERDRVLDSFTRAARFVADSHGHPLGLDATGAVRATAVAALADEAAADAVAGGALVRTLDYAGFGEVDVSDAVAAEVTRRHRDTRGRGDLRDPRAPSGGNGEASGGDPAPGGGADGLAGPTTTSQVAPTEADTARRRHESRLREDLDQADRELARASLAEAEARRRAEKAAARRDELTRLLQTAEAEARAEAEAAEAATCERRAAAAAQESARARLAALDPS